MACKKKQKKQTKLIKVVIALVAGGLFFSPLAFGRAGTDGLTGPEAQGYPQALLVEPVSLILNKDFERGYTGGLELTGRNSLSENARVLLGDEVIDFTNSAGQNPTELARAKEGSQAVRHRAGDTVWAFKQTVQLQFENGDYVIQKGDQIVITVPVDFGNFAFLTAKDVAAVTEEGAELTVTGVKQVLLAENLQQRIILTAKEDFSDADEEIRITIGGRNQLACPVRSGNYVFKIAILDKEREEVELGFAILSWANKFKVVEAEVGEVEVIALVTEAGVEVI